MSDQTSIAEFNRVEAALAELERDVTPVPDCSTPEGLAEAKARKKPLQKLRTGGEEARLAYTKNLRKEVDRVNKMWKEDIAPRIEKMEKPLTDAIKAEDDKRKAEIEAKAAYLQDEIDAYDEDARRSVAAQQAELERQKAELQAEKDRVAEEAAELEREKQAEADRIAADERRKAEEAARIERERLAEIERKEAAERAEKEKAEAVEAARLQAIEDERERQAQEARDKAEAEKAVEAKRVAAEKREAKKAAARPYVEKLRAWFDGLPEMPGDYTDDLHAAAADIANHLGEINRRIEQAEQATQEDKAA